MEEHSPETTSFSFSSDVTKNKELVSIILKWPTVHPIQTNHLFPVQIYLQALRRFFPLFILFFSLLSLPIEPTGQWGQSENQTNNTLQPLWIFKGQRLPRSFLFASVMNKWLLDNTDIHRCALAFPPAPNFWFLFPFCRKCKQKKNKVFY